MTPEHALPYRVAIYYAPPAQSAWWEAGSRWLGRCAFDDQPRVQPVIDDLAAADFARLTAEPRRYGWHGTLKAPFRLADGIGLADVRTALRALCARHTPFDLGPLQVSRLDEFLALQPAQDSAALNALAADCVQGLQPLARPLDEAELTRRRRANLSPGQDALLQIWGYPYVLEEFRFHVSLTGPLAGLSGDAAARLERGAAEYFGALPPCRIDCLSLFIEPERDAPFRLLEQIGFAS